MPVDSLALMLKDALVSGVDRASEIEAIQIAKKCVDAKTDAQALIKSISEAFKTIGEKYEKGIYYLPELMFAGSMAQNVLGFLGPILSRGSSTARSKVVIGTVRGDLHDLGKNIVALMLKPAGFGVVDLGVDVAPEKFAEAVRTHKASLLCLSSLLSTTRSEMKRVIEELERRRMRDKVKIIVGGGAVSKEFASEIGADAYGKDAIEAVKLCTELAGG